MSPNSVGSTSQKLADLAAVPYLPVCGLDQDTRCLAQIQADAINTGRGHTQTINHPTPPSVGLGATALQQVYNIPSSGGSGLWIAIVDANDDPTAETDMAAYRAQYGLPPCTTANGCFKKLNQNGQQGSYPAADPGWAMEISLDLDMASAACPSCNIMLVEANSPSGDLYTAVQTAVSQGAAVVSMSFGSSEATLIQNLSSQGATLSQLDSAFSGNVGFFAASGDQGYLTGYPASSPSVVAVGGTVVTADSTSSRGFAEGVWGNASNSQGGTGSGCSGQESKPSWQTDTGCQNRMTNDVSAVAGGDGVLLYITGGQVQQGGTTYILNGWFPMGGTSAATPLIAAIYAATGHASESPSFAYRHTTAFNDVTTGTNGNCAGQPSYFCNAQAGYDGPTGLGTPNGQALAAIPTGG
jgi:subtilase family serine protease